MPRPPMRDDRCKTLIGIGGAAALRSGRESSELFSLYPMQTPARTIRILAISGSLRKVSSNTALLSAAIALAPENVEIKLYGGLGALPPFNPDLEPMEPPSVTDLKRHLQWSDSLLISIHSKSPIARLQCHTAG